MDRSAVKRIVDREIEPLMRRLGIPHWKIRVSYDPREARANGDVQQGNIEWRVDYNTAVININPDAFDDDDAAQVIRTLRHELFHIVASPISIVYSMLQEMLKDEPIQFDMIDSVWTHASEQTVINLERMFLGLTDMKGRDPMSKKATPAKPPKPKLPKPAKAGKTMPPVSRAMKKG